MLLAWSWLANWYLMCGPHGNSGSDDLDERGSVFSLSLYACWPLQETSSQWTVWSNTPNTFCQLFTVWPTTARTRDPSPNTWSQTCTPCLKIVHVFVCFCLSCDTLVLTENWANWSFAQSANLCHSCESRTIINWNVN